MVFMNVEESDKDFIMGMELDIDTVPWKPE